MAKPQFRQLGSPAFICLLLALATFAVYFPVQNYDFVNYDDSSYFSSNSHVLSGLTRANIQWAFTSGEYANWHPLTWLSLMLDATLFGHGAAAPHLTNVLLHAMNSILVFLLLRQLTGAFLRSAAVAMLFAIHPLHVESVAWISERKDVLSGFFGLLTLLSYARYARKEGELVRASFDSLAPARSALRPLASPNSFRRFPNGSSPRLLRYGMALFFFVCGLMSKPMVVTLPFVMLLLDYWPLERFNRTSFPRLFLEKIPFFIFSAVASVITYIVQQKGGATTLLINTSLAGRIENAFVSYARYLWKTLFPVNLAAPYPHPLSWPVSLVIFSVVLFGSLCFATAIAGEKFPWLFTGWFWFAGMLVPVIGFVQVGMPAMADRYMYLPIIGLLIILVWGVNEICCQWQAPRSLIIVLAASLFLACGLRARNQVTVWQNDGTLFGHAVDVTKNNYIASLNLAFWCSQTGRNQDALHYYDDALRMSSNDLTALSLSTHDRLQAALYCYYNALRLNPNDPTELYNIGNSFAKLGDWDEAIRDYRRALQITPDQPDIMDNLGFALVKEKQYSAAATNFLAVIKLKPDSAGAHNNLASVLFVQGRYQDAAEQFQAALQTAPGEERIYVNLAETYVRLSRTNQAVEYYQRALKLHPNDPQVIAQLQKLGIHSSN